MKKNLIKIAFLVTFVLVAGRLFAQETKPIDDKFKKEVSEKYKDYKEKYEASYNAPFEIVWNAVQKSLNDVGCQVASKKSQQNEQGLFKGNIKSEYCVFVTQCDSTYTVLQRNSLDLPFIRGGVWLNGRILYKFTLKEINASKVDLTLLTEMSGFENHVTNEMQYWKSNGKLEKVLMETILKNVAAANKQ